MSGTERNPVYHFVTLYIKVTMSEEGSHAPFATMETRLVSAGKVDKQTWKVFLCYKVAN